MANSPRRPRWSIRVVVACFAAAALVGAAGCATDNGDGAATGGTTGTTGSGGAKGSGGVVGTGGHVGTTSSGGMVGTGNAPGTGGVTDRGGSIGTSSGGAVGGGGRGATGGRGGATGGGATTGRGGATGTSTGGTVGSAGGSTGSGTGADPCATVAAPTGGKMYSGGYGTGMAGTGYTYNLYSNGSGSDTMTVYGVDATFSATWSNTGDFIARVGLGFNSTKTPDQIGTITATFQETKSGTGGSYNYIGLYGWSENPLHEYYIVEDWFGSRPNPGTKMGTIMVDGANYDVYTHTQNNQPAITGGNQTFVQFFSVRQTARQCGTMSVSEHFAAWEKMNMQLGNLEEARLLVEAGNVSGSGNITFSVATVTLQ